jgi:hypothetical protein
VPVAATVPASTTTVPASTAVTTPFRVGGRRGQQSRGDRGRDQQGFEAQHGKNSFVPADLKAGFQSVSTRNLGAHHDRIAATRRWFHDILGDW